MHFQGLERGDPGAARLTAPYEHGGCHPPLQLGLLEDPEHSRTGTPQLERAGVRWGLALPSPRLVGAGRVNDIQCYPDIDPLLLANQERV